LRFLFSLNTLASTTAEKKNGMNFDHIIAEIAHIQMQTKVLLLSPEIDRGGLIKIMDTQRHLWE
jgi:hypothetical protein